MSSNNIFEMRFAKTLRTFFGTKKEIPLHDPYFFGDEKKFLSNCIDSTYVSSVGEYITEFEKKISTFTNAKYAVAVNNGTCGLHLGILCSDYNYGDEIFVPSLTFVATVNSILHANATPHFVDLCSDLLDIDYEKLEQYISESCFFDGETLFNKSTKKRIVALSLVHIFGHPMNIDKALKFTKKYHIDLIEDAAESLGSYFKKKHTGTFGKFGVLSFNGNKIITTGGGGMILTNNKKFAHKLKHISTTAKKKHPWIFEHDSLGYNYRLPNLNAALGLAQFIYLDKIIEFKRSLHKLYVSHFENFDEFIFVSEPSNSKSNYWLQTIKLNTKNSNKKDSLIKTAYDMNIQLRPIWLPSHKFSYLKHYPKMNLDNTNSLQSRLINIPSGFALKDLLNV